MIPRHLQVAVGLMLIVLVALGFYAWHLKRRADAIQALQADTRPVAPPVAGSPQAVTLFVAYDDEGLLRQRQVSVTLPAEPSERARQALRALLAVYLEQPSPHPLGNGSDVNDVYLIGDNTAVIDMNAAFAEAHRSGILVEQMTIVSMLQTVSVAVPKITRVRILIDGKPRETLAGHVDLSGYFDMALINQFAKELQ
jgi:hypothetical protein